MKLSLGVLGGKRLRVSAQNRTAVVDLCLQNGLAYRDFCWEPDGSVSFSMTYGAAARLRRACRAAGIDVETVATYGLPSLLQMLRRRMGLLLGGALALALLFLSSRFVWDVEITGNEHMSEAEICAVLRECGLGVGSYAPDLHERAIENRALLASDRIAWIAVYMDGTVARVQVIERDAPPEPIAPSVDSSSPANLIAACDGQIELVQIYRGEKVVSIGQAVRKGELLVSGIYTSQNAGFRYTRAAGEVWARTEHTYRIEIPLSFREKVYQDAKTQGITLNFFNFPLKIFKSTGNVTDNCDIIEENIGAASIGERDLPFFFTRTYARTYTWEERTRTAERATELAYEELEATLAALSNEAELLSRRSEIEITDTAVILSCTVACIENIAVQSEFEIRETD